jgi:catechol 2,3-dioxygenase-like lactoylglutathione lyase family enzyme
MVRCPGTSRKTACDGIRAALHSAYDSWAQLFLSEGSKLIVTIFVTDMDRAVRFYVEAMDCKIQFHFGNEWAQLKSLDGTTIGLHPASEETPAGVKGSIHLGILVTDSIQKVVEEMKAKGVKFLGPIRDDEQILYAAFEDPDGTPLYLAQPKQAWTT